MNEIEKGILSTDENPIMYPPTLGGIKVFLSDWMERTKKTVVPRTWKERLLSTPWRPWIKTTVFEEPFILKMIVPFDYYMFTVDTRKGEEVLVMHPEVYSKLKETIQAEENIL